VNFSRARVLSGVIFQKPGPFYKNHGPRVDYPEVQGLLCKILKQTGITNYFRKRNPMDLFHGW
jgi:hypothetical protein